MTSEDLTDRRHCPPCCGDCRQGRDCPADDAGALGGRELARVIALLLLPLLVTALSLWAWRTLA